jgi:imidazole glycerol-phosphate synthase subunit HisH
MIKKVSIIDYGMSNLLSICRAVEHVGAEAIVVQSAAEIRNADYLILPGVGAFPDGMHELNSRGLSESIIDFSQKERPLLGVCLGMQMLLSVGMEHKETPGLNIIEGEVLPLPKNMPLFKVPNINWHSIFEPKDGVWENTLLRETIPESCFYFVHSYYAKPFSESDVLAESRFGDLIFAAAVKKNNVSGTQFHPEKSGEEGLKLLKNFMLQ